MSSDNVWSRFWFSVKAPSDQEIMFSQVAEFTFLTLYSLSRVLSVVAIRAFRAMLEGVAVSSTSMSLDYLDVSGDSNLTLRKSY